MMRSCTRTNSSPMMRRFFSGSQTVASGGRNCSSACSIATTPAPRDSNTRARIRSRPRASAPCPRRRRARRSGPSARRHSVKATVESTPPLTKKNTLRSADAFAGSPPRAWEPGASAPSPARSRRCRTGNSTAPPGRAWCAPLPGETALRRAAARDPTWPPPRRCWCVPITRKPSGTEATASRWLIQICWLSGTPARSGSALPDVERRQAVLALIALPYRAAQVLRHQLLAVADAEHGLSQREDSGIHRRAAFVVDAGRAARDDQALEPPPTPRPASRLRAPPRIRPARAPCGRSGDSIVRPCREPRFVTFQCSYFVVCKPLRDNTLGIFQ